MRRFARLLAGGDHERIASQGPRLRVAETVPLAEEFAAGGERFLAQARKLPEKGEGVEVVADLIALGEAHRRVFGDLGMALMDRGARCRRYDGSRLAALFERTRPGATTMGIRWRCAWIIAKLEPRGIDRWLVERVSEIPLEPGCAIALMEALVARVPPAEARAVLRARWPDGPGLVARAMWRIAEPEDVERMRQALAEESDSREAAEWRDLIAKAERRLARESG